MDPLAAAFASPFDPARGRPTAIYEGEPLTTGRPTTKRPSGAILNLDARFASVTSAFKDGLSAWIDPLPAPKLRAALAFSIARTADALADDEAGTGCGAIVFRAEKWAPGVDVPAPQGARVWRAIGTAAGGAPWIALAIDAPLRPVGSANSGPLRVRGCVGWDAGSPEIEALAVEALKSVRLGDAPPNDVNGL